MAACSVHAQSEASAISAPSPVPNPTMDPGRRCVRGVRGEGRGLRGRRKALQDIKDAIETGIADGLRAGPRTAMPFIRSFPSIPFLLPLCLFAGLAIMLVSALARLCLLVGVCRACRGCR